MTQPHQHNCPHSGEGWCLECVAGLHATNEHLRQALGIVTVRSTSGLTETVCQAHLLPRHHQMLLDECERLRNELHHEREQNRRQSRGQA